MSSNMFTYNFEYAVRLDALLVSLFYFDGNKWRFVRNVKRWNGITMIQLEQAYSDNSLFVFPLGMLPDQIWNLLHNIENDNL